MQQVVNKQLLLLMSLFACHTQESSEQIGMASPASRPLPAAPESSWRPRRSLTDLGSLAGTSSFDTLSDLEVESGGGGGGGGAACVTWREALAAAFPIMAAWPLSASVASRTVRAVRYCKV